MWLLPAPMDCDPRASFAALPEDGWEQSPLPSMAQPEVAGVCAAPNSNEKPELRHHAPDLDGSHLARVSILSSNARWRMSDGFTKKDSCSFCVAFVSSHTISSTMSPSVKDVLHFLPCSLP